jgi:carbon monoxide dehydrogenase subunit G
MQIIKYVGIIMLFVAAGFYGMILLAPSELEYQVNEDIQAPIEEVFEAISSPDMMTKWMKGLESVKGAEIELSAEYDLYYPQEMIMHRVVKVYEDPTRIVNEGIVKEFFSRLDDYTLEAIDSNKTRVSWRVKMTSLDMKSRMIMKAEDSHKTNTAANLTALKEYLKKG